MEIRSNNKAKHRSQRLAFGIFRLLSLCIVLILFAILGFIIYKGAGAGVECPVLSSNPACAVGPDAYKRGACRCHEYIAFSSHCESESCTE